MSVCKRCGHISEIETMALSIVEINYEKQRMDQLRYLRDKLARFREKLNREKMADIIYRCGYPSIRTKARASTLALSLIAYLTE